MSNAYLEPSGGMLLHASTPSSSSQNPSVERIQMVQRLGEEVGRPGGNNRTECFWFKRDTDEPKFDYDTSKFVSDKPKFDSITLKSDSANPSLKDVQVTSLIGLAA
jgi:hypothetical protein